MADDFNLNSNSALYHRGIHPNTPVFNSGQTENDRIRIGLAAKLARFLLLILIGLALALCYIPDRCHCQVYPSLMGYSGLLNIPSADIVPDRQLVLGMSFIPKPYAVLLQPRYNNFNYYAVVGYLPFLEITMGFARPDHFNSRWGIGDRTGSFKIRCWRERKWLPQTTVGLHDPFGLAAQDWAQNYSALYLVMTKTFQVPILHRARLHYGYGVDWLPAAKHRLVGHFGGLELSLLPHVAGFVEYDTEQINAGFSLTLFSHLRLLLGWLDLHAFTGAVTLNFRL